MTDTSQFTLDQLLSENLSLCILHGKKRVFESNESALKPLLECIRQYPDGLPGCVAYDRVVGLAAAILFERLGVADVNALTGSRSAANRFRESGMACQFEQTVLEILNRERTGQCPMEELASRSEDATSFLKTMLCKSG